MTERLVGRRLPSLSRAEWVVAAILLASCATAAVAGDPILAVYLLAVFVSIPLLAGRLAAPNDVAFARKLVLVGLALHTVVALAGRLIAVKAGHNILFFDDEFGYDRVAVAESRHWLGHGPGPLPADGYLVSAFTYVLAVGYTLGGYDPASGLVITAAFGLLTGVVVHRIALLVWGPGVRRPARAAAVLAALYPTVFGWSSLLLKDSSIFFATSGLLLSALMLSRGSELSWRSRATVMLAGVLCLAWLVSVRPSQAAAIVAGLALWVVVRLVSRGVFARAAMATAVIAGVVAVLVIPAMRHRVDKVPTRLATQRSASAVGARTALESPGAAARASSWGSTLGYLPKGAIALLLRPLPWEARTASQAAGALVNVVALVLYAAAIRGALLLRRMANVDALLPLVLPLAAVWLILALVEGNAGTAFRHRDAVFPIVAVLAGGGLASVQRWPILGRRAHRHGDSPAGSRLRLRSTAHP